MNKTFENRLEAGEQLGEELLKTFAGRKDLVTLGLPRGGVAVAYGVAKALDAPLDVFVVRKLGVPGHQELAMGAIASGDVKVLNHDVVDHLVLSDADINASVLVEKQELARRERAYRGRKPALELTGKTVILVDDGLATGATMHAAIIAARRRDAEAVISAVPVASPEAAKKIEREADGLISLMTPSLFEAVGQWYSSFEQLNDREVCRLLEQYWGEKKSRQ
jgi:putative phosphoribosyl transferase